MSISRHERDGLDGALLYVKPLNAKDESAEQGNVPRAVKKDAHRQVRQENAFVAPRAEEDIETAKGVVVDDEDAGVARGDGPHDDVNCKGNDLVRCQNEGQKRANDRN